MPVIIPVPEPTVATAVLVLLHAPPGVASLTVVVAPVHRDKTPEMAAGNGLTVIVVIEAHPSV